MRKLNAETIYEIFKVLIQKRIVLAKTIHGNTVSMYMYISLQCRARQLLFTHFFSDADIVLLVCQMDIIIVEVEGLKGSINTHMIL